MRAEHESTTAVVCFSFCFAFQFQVQNKVEWWMYSPYTFACMHLCACPYVYYFKVYMGLVGFCAEDEVGLFPILSHLQMKYAVPKVCLVNLVTSTR